MAANFRVITGANLFCNDDPDQSNHLQLTKVAIPDLTRTMEDHMAAGSFMSMAVDMDMYEALTLPFSFAGVDDAMLSRIGLNDATFNTYTVWKEVMDTKTREKLRFECTVRGQLGSASQDGFEKGSMSGFDYEVQGIDSYRLSLGQTVIYDFDWHSNRRIVRGVDQSATTNGILGIT